MQKIDKNGLPIRYHVNNNTQRPNRCYAKTEDSCRVKAPIHFDSKEEVRNFIAEEAAKGKETVSSIGKGKKATKSVKKPAFLGNKSVKEIIDGARDENGKIELNALPEEVKADLLKIYAEKKQEDDKKRKSLKKGEGFKKTVTKKEVASKPQLSDYERKVFEKERMEKEKTRKYLDNLDNNGPLTNDDITAWYGDLSESTFAKFGTIKEFSTSSNSITFTNPHGQKISFSVEGDCCSNSYLEDENSINPQGKVIKSIALNSYSSFEDVDVWEVKKVNGWTITYQDGTSEDFKDVNHSNGYYGTMTSFQVHI